LIGTTCEYIRGDRFGDPEKFYFLSWDRLNIFLPETAKNNPFHIIVPDILAPNKIIPFKYAVQAGTYDP